jgi:myo-inositol-1(or 4)-monophosphatase
MLALETVREAGRLVMEFFRKPMDVVLKSPDQPLTQADLAADALLRERLLAARASYGWLSEETADSPVRLTRSHVWIVDPIDGTRSFIAGRPEFTISLGLAVDGVATLGVVANPATDEVFWAERSGGAFMARGAETGRPMRVRDNSRGGAEVILASRTEIAAGEFADLADAWHIEPLGSTAYKLAAVAAGRGDVFLSRGPKSEWDVCGGALILEEAGGRFTDLNGAAPLYNRNDPYVHGVLAGGHAAHDRLFARIRTLPPPARLIRDPRTEEV